MREVFVNLADFDIRSGRLSKGEREDLLGGLGRNIVGVL